MATRKTTSENSSATNTTDALARARIAINVAWEIDACVSALDCADDGEVDSCVAKMVSRRVRELACAIMSAADSGEDPADICSRVGLSAPADLDAANAAAAVLAGRETEAA